MEEELEKRLLNILDYTMTDVNMEPAEAIAEYVKEHMGLKINPEQVHKISVMYQNAQSYLGKFPKTYSSENVRKSLEASKEREEQIKKATKFDPKKVRKPFGG